MSELPMNTTTDDAAPAAGRTRRRGALLLLAGLALVVGGGALAYWLIEQRSSLDKAAALPFFLGFVLLLEGTVEAVSGKSWSEHPSWRRMLFIVLGTPAVAAAVLAAFAFIASLRG